MMELAEGVGFEPTRPFGLPVFKTGAINHSTTPPKISIARSVPSLAGSARWTYVTRFFCRGRRCRPNGKLTASPTKLPRKR